MSGYVVDLRRWRAAHNRPPDPADHRSAERLACRLLIDSPADASARLARIRRMAGESGAGFVVHHLDALRAQVAGRAVLP